MLILRNIIITILLIALAAIAVVGIMVEWPQVFNWTPDRINALGRSVLTIMRPGLLLFIVWWVILLSTALVFFMTIARPRRRMKIEVQMGGGRVVIMDAAIKKYIRNALAEMGEITVKKIDLREHRNLVTTDITADVRTRENLPTLERRIISRVRSALAEDLGITNLGDVHVFIRNFEVTGRPIKADPVAAEKSETSREKKTADEPREEPLKDKPAYVGTAAATAAGAGIAGTGSGDENATPTHALTEPVEPAGSTEPIVITDDSEEAQPGAGETGSESEQKVGPGVLETSPPEEVILAEKPLPGEISEDAEPDAADHEDMDHPLPWSNSPPDDEDKDPEDRGPLPL